MSLLGSVKAVVSQLFKKNQPIKITEVHVKEPAKTLQKKVKSKSKVKDRSKDIVHKKVAAKLDISSLIENFTPENWEPVIPEVHEEKKRFYDMQLPHQILRGIHDTGFQYCTQIQSEILPHSLKGLDVTGRAQTGTGKTAAFLLTIFNRLTEQPVKTRKIGAPRALVMAPTRELVLQIEKDAKALGAFTSAKIVSVFGGVSYESQSVALTNDYIDIIIATPGRILDYCKQKVVRLDRVEILVLDEADRMLDMGFLPDMRKIINATPPKEERQTMLFSATMTPNILRLASLWTNNPVEVDIEPEQMTSSNIEQIAYIITQDEKFTVLYNLLKKYPDDRIIIFANRRDQVKKLTEKLQKYKFSCGMLTGDVNQMRRIKTLEALRTGSIKILIATDVAGRGIHVDDIAAVVNYNLPNCPDDYVHRIGRTGRAGAKGFSVAFATEEDAYVLPLIEEHIKEKLKYITPDEDLLAQI